MNFNETLKKFSKFKEEKTGSGNVTAEEVRQIREHIQAMSESEKKANSYKEANEGKNFMKVVREYASFKEAETGSNHVTAEEIKQLREGLVARAQKMEESKVEEKTEQTFENILQEFAAFKKANGADEKVTIAERVELRKTFNAQLKAIKEAAEKPAEEKPAEEKVEAPKTLKEAVEAASAKKLAETGDRKITREEFEAIKKEFNESKAAAEATTEEKPAEKVEESTSNVEKVIASLKEAANCVKLGRHALKEGDLPMAQDMAAQAGAAVDAANAALPAPVEGETPVDPVLAQKVTDVKVAVDDLAAAAGVAAPADLGADPNAGIPAVEGQPAAGDAALDPAAQTPAAPAPVQESVESEIQARIDARKAELEESAKNPYEVKDITGEPLADNTVIQGAGEETNASQLAKVPTAKQLLAGSDKDVYRFGDKETTTPPKGVKESTLPEADINKYLEKLDFKKIFTVLEQND